MCGLFNCFQNCGGDRRVIVLDESSGKIISIFDQHMDVVRALDISADGKMIASGDDSGSVIITNPQGEMLFVFTPTGGWIRCLKFSQDGRYLAVGDDYGNIYVYDTETKVLTIRHNSGAAPVEGLSFSPDGKELSYATRSAKVASIAVERLNIASVFTLRDRSDRTPPQIYISNPAQITDDKVRVYKDLIDLRGTLMDDSGIRTLRVNGITVPLKENGNFIIHQSLSMGDNPIVVEATDINGNIAVRRFIIQRKNMDGENYDASKARNFLFVVGINDYQYWPRLSNAVKDASDITSTLLKLYNFDFGYVTLLKNEQATRSNIYTSLRSLIEQVTPQDNLVIYFSGHGYFDAVLNEGYWIPVDAKINASGDYLSNSDILMLVSNIDSQHTFVIADACFSGSLFSESKRGYAENVERYKSRWGLASGRLEVVSDGAAGTNSPFATATLTFLAENTKDKVAISELIQYVKLKVAETSDQTPLGNPLRVAGDEGGELVLYRKMN